VTSLRRCFVTAVVCAGAAAWWTGVTAQQPAPSLFGEMRWRTIGPHRGGRTKAASGVPSQPNVFYVGAVNGGVWKTTDYGRVWTPIFDDQPTGSIGALAVAPSDPNTVYVGSGEGLQRPDLATGDGIYKSTDAGKTWTHLGLRDGQQIPQIIVDPKDPNRMFVAVLGHPYGPNEERGIFRSTDGARTFQKVLYKDVDTGGVDVAFDPQNSQTVYAVLWQARQGPWENGVFTGPGSGVFKSMDGGNTWKPIVSGLPTFAEDGLGRIGITVAPTPTPELRRVRCLPRRGCCRVSPISLPHARRAFSHRASPRSFPTTRPEWTISSQPRRSGRAGTTRGRISSPHSRSTRPMAGSTTEMFRPISSAPLPASPRRSITSTKACAASCSRPCAATMSAGGS